MEELETSPKEDVDLKTSQNDSPTTTVETKTQKQQDVEKDSKGGDIDKSMPDLPEVPTQRLSPMPFIVKCPAPDCGKRYRHTKGLEFHVSHSHPELKQFDGALLGAEIKEKHTEIDAKRSEEMSPTTTAESTMKPKKMPSNNDDILLDKTLRDSRQNFQKFECLNGSDAVKPTDYIDNLSQNPPKGEISSDNMQLMFNPSKHEQVKASSQQVQEASDKISCTTDTVLSPRDIKRIDTLQPLEVAMEQSKTKRPSDCQTSREVYKGSLETNWISSLNADITSQLSNRQSEASPSVEFSSKFDCQFSVKDNQTPISDKTVSNKNGQGVVGKMSAVGKPESSTKNHPNRAAAAQPNLGAWNPFLPPGIFRDQYY